MRIALSQTFIISFFFVFFMVRFMDRWTFNHFLNKFPQQESLEPSGSIVVL